MSRGTIKQLLLSNKYWVLNKDIVQLFGLETAFLLSNFAEAEQTLADKEGWFYQTSNTVEKMTTLSRHKQDQCIKQLEELNILEKDVKGMPPKRYFRINHECLTNQFVKFQQINLRNIDKSICKKSATSKEHTNKEIIDKEISTTSSTCSSKTTTNKKDTDLIIEKWNELGLQRLRNINSNTNRYKLLNARIKEYGLTDVVQAIDNVKKSSFLQGQNKKGWIITFDWLVRPNNFLKVLEGNYTDKGVKGGENNGRSVRKNKYADVDLSHLEYKGK